MSAPVYTAIVVFFLSIPVFAAAPVSDIRDQAGGDSGSQTSTTNTNSMNVVVSQAPPEPLQAPATDSYYQMQLLQDEVRSLRGMIEEQNNEIRQLKKRQMDDYMDLDRRLSALSQGGAVTPAAANNMPRGSDSNSQSSSPTNIPPTASTAPSQTTAEKDQYDHAYGQLKAGKVDEAVTEFKAHIAKYPNGKFVANAHYWLGEIYVLKNQLEPARQSFTTVVEQYPAHRKAPDSTFKLGQVYFMLGNKAKAKELLEQAAKGNDNAARLAKGYLEENF